jgi:SAM-dependent methyltransferase
MLDYERGGLRGEFVYRDGDDTKEAPVYEHYFSTPDEWGEEILALLDAFEGPVVDVGCGAGKHALYLQEDHEVVAFDVSPNAVRAARERGVSDAREMSMFEMDLPRDRFRSALVNGTQIGLAGSLAGARAFLSDLAEITDPEAVAVVDNYDPTTLDGDRLLGYRPDPRPGMARRTFHFEYVREGEREVGPSLDFVLFGPDRLREVVVGTLWDVERVNRMDGFYKALLAK